MEIVNLNFSIDFKPWKVYVTALDEPILGIPEYERCHYKIYFFEVQFSQKLNNLYIISAKYCHSTAARNLNPALIDKMYEFNIDPQTEEKIYELVKKSDHIKPLLKQLKTKENELIRFIELKKQSIVDLNNFIVLTELINQNSQLK